MASKKAASPGIKSKSRLTSAKQIWKAVSSGSWHRTLNARKPGGNWVLQGTKIKGCCPYHRETSPSFHIDLERGYAKCYGGSCNKYRDDPVTFLSEITGLSMQEVLTDIVQGEWNVSLPKSLSGDLQKQKEQADLRRALQDVCHTALVFAVQNVGDPAWAWAQPSVQWLAGRGIDLNNLRGVPIGILPTRRILYNSLLDVAHRQAFASYLGDVLVPEGTAEIGAYTGAVTFHYMLTPGTAGGIKVRKPNSGKDVLWAGGEGQDNHGIFGLDLLTAFLGAPTAVYVVEGEFDALSILQAQVATHGSLQYGVVAGSGSSVGSLDCLDELGCDNIRILADYDTGGDGFTCLALSQTLSPNVSVYDWADGCMSASPGADPDEVVTGGHFNALELDFQTPDLWLPRHAWVSQRIREIAASTQGDLSALQSGMSEYGKCLHSLIDKDAVLQDLKEDVNIPRSVLQATLMAASTDEAYVAMIGRHLSLEMVPLAHDGMQAVVYACRDGKVVNLPLNRVQDLLTVLSTQVLHNLPYEWCREHLGDPDWLMFGVGESEDRLVMPYAIRTARNNELLIQAVLQVCTSLPDKARMTVKRQGVHCYEDLGTNTRAIYVVNGAQVYKGSVHGAEPLTFETLSSPVDHGWMFMAGRGAQWSSVIADVETLNKPCEASPADTYLTIRDMIEANWTFSLNDDRQKLEAGYLAAVVMYTIIAQGFPYVSQILLNAPSNTGKSKLLMGLFSGSQFDKIKLVEHAIGMDAYTVAGVFQSMEGSGLMLCLDEFEVSNSQDPKRQKIVTELLSTMRMNYASGTRKVQGTASQEASYQGFRVPVMAAAITGFDRVEDANRWNTITLHNVSAAAGPDENIVRQYTQDQISNLRTACTLLPLQNYGVIYEKYLDLHSKFGTLSGLPKGTSDRMLQPMLPVMAVMDWCGQDVSDFLPRYLEHKVESSKSEIRAVYQQILHDVLNTPAVLVPGDMDRIKTSVAAVLQSAGGPSTINATQCGVYVDDLSKYVVIVVAQVHHTTLRTLARYRDQNTTYLRKQLQQHPEALKEKEVIAARILHAMQRHVSLDTTVNDIVVYPIEKLVATSRASNVVYQSPDAEVQIAKGMMPLVPEVDEDDSMDM